MTITIASSLYQYNFKYFYIVLVYLVYFQLLVTVVIAEGAVNQDGEGNESAITKQKPV